MRTKQLDICVMDLMHQAQRALNQIIEPKNKVEAIAKYLTSLAMLNAAIDEDTLRYGAYFERIKNDINPDTLDYYSEALEHIEAAISQTERPNVSTSAEIPSVQEEKSSAKQPTDETLQVVYLDETNHFKIYHENALTANVAGLSPQDLETWIDWFEEYCKMNDSQKIEDDFKQFCNNVYNHFEEVDKDTLLAYIFSLYAKLYPEN